MSSNKIIVFTGPSAVGKETIETELLKDKSLRLEVAVSATTRKPRPGEKHGDNYYFISEPEFKKRIANNEFIEWNQHFGNYYGTLKSEIARILSQNKVPFLEIEVVGAENVLKLFGSDRIITIFLAPPSLSVLHDRIKSRGSESEAQITDRLRRAEVEMTKKVLFSHVVVNDQVGRAVQEIKAILRSSQYALYN